MLKSILSFPPAALKYILLWLLASDCLGYSSPSLLLRMSNVSATEVSIKVIIWAILIYLFLKNNLFLLSPCLEQSNTIDRTLFAEKIVLVSCWHLLEPWSHFCANQLTAVKLCQFWPNHRGIIKYSKRFQWIPTCLFTMLPASQVLNVKSQPQVRSSSSEVLWQFSWSRCRA